MGKKRRLPQRLPKATQRFFPNLIEYTVTSPKDAAYNCVAFAAGDTTRKWDPGMLPAPGYYWPPGALEDDNDDVDALKRAFAEIGFEECATGELEAGIQKVALYAMVPDDWLHAAVQEPSGEWSSKLGNGYDIRHKTPHCMEGPLYGTVMCFMKRRI
ncbi:MAG: hypothetical protein HY289_03870 [Planctomycetes bacterium]|nr:hypothetical protein [Planctomycetota bacterium]